jgi:hypothetical protein
MTRPTWFPIKDAARRIGVARPTLWSWLSVLPPAEVKQDGKRWFLAPALVERLRCDQRERAAVAARAFQLRSGALAKLQADVEALKGRVARLERRGRPA